MMMGDRKPINKDTVESVRHKLTGQAKVPGQLCFLDRLISNTICEESFCSLAVQTFLRIVDKGVRMWKSMRKGLQVSSTCWRGRNVLGMVGITTSCRSDVIVSTILHGLLWLVGKTL